MRTKPTGTFMKEASHRCYLNPGPSPHHPTQNEPNAGYLIMWRHTKAQGTSENSTRKVTLNLTNLPNLIKPFNLQ